MVAYAIELVEEDGQGAREGTSCGGSATARLERALKLRASRTAQTPTPIAARIPASLLATALGCSAADLFENQTPTPQLTLTLVPTFTSTPERPQEVIIITPPFQERPG